MVRRHLMPTATVTVIQAATGVLWWLITVIQVVVALTGGQTPIRPVAVSPWAQLLPVTTMGIEQHRSHGCRFPSWCRCWWQFV